MRPPGNLRHATGGTWPRSGSTRRPSSPRSPPTSPCPVRETRTNILALTLVGLVVLPLIRREHIGEGFMRTVRRIPRKKHDSRRRRAVSGSRTAYAMRTRSFHPPMRRAPPPSRSCPRSRNAAGRRASHMIRRPGSRCGPERRLLWEWTGGPHTTGRRQCSTLSATSPSSGLPSDRLSPGWNRTGVNAYSPMTEGHWPKRRPRTIRRMRRRQGREPWDS